MEPTTGTEIAIIRTSLPTILAADENDILGKLAAKVKAHKADISTTKGRDAIRSLAAEIASSKVTLIKLGKSLTEGWRKSTKAVNEECNTIEEKMDALKEQVRKPLTDFENADKVRIAAHEAALAQIEALGNIQSDWSSDKIAAANDMLADIDQSGRDWQEFSQRANDAIARVSGIILRAHASAFEREVEAAELARLRAAEAERQRLAAIEAQRQREEQIARDAADAARLAAEAKARREAEEAATAVRHEQEAAAAKARAETDAAAKRERDALAEVDRAKRAAEQAEADLLASIERERIAAERAEINRKAEIARAEREKVEAVEAERRRAAKEAADAQAAAEASAANQKHRGSIMRTAKEALMEYAGIDEETAKRVVLAISRDQVPAVSVRF